MHVYHNVKHIIIYKKIINIKRNRTSLMIINYIFDYLFMFNNTM